jgi:hypothetical protein
MPRSHFADVSEQRTASVLMVHPEDGGSTFLRSVVLHQNTRCHIPEDSTLFCTSTLRIDVLIKGKRKGG